MNEDMYLHQARADAGPPTFSPKSTNNGDSELVDSLDSLNLGTAAAIALPPSSPAIQSPYGEREGRGSDLTPLAKIRRTASSNTLGVSSRSATPTLRTKSSLSSLKGTGGPTPPRSPAARRVSSNHALNGQFGMSPKPTLSSSVEEPQPAPVPTVASVAKEYFEREMEVNNNLNSKSGLTVVLHDSCYGHRFSRPKTSKASLATIVERPERMLAIVLGVSAAYVLLGGRHSGGENVPHPQRSASSIPFKIQKSSRFVPLTSPVVTSVHGNKWMSELKKMCEGAEAKLAMNGKELARPALSHGEKAMDDRPKLHEGDLYLCSESLKALEGALGGVLDAVDAVFSSAEHNRAFVGIRPPGHHCSDDYPSGFCWINNVHVGISHAASVHGLTHAAIIDFDLHHGDGSQSITWSHNVRAASLPKNASASKKTAIGYFSLHDINSYPCEWGDEEKVKNASLCVENAHGQSIWNVHLQAWKTDAEFWQLYESRYLVLLEKTRSFLQTQYNRLVGSNSPSQPRAVIFISAGFDASEWEGQGMQRHEVNVPTDFYARFTKDINNLADEEGLAVDGRVVSVLEGGYSDRALMSGVLSHLSGMTTPSVPTQTVLRNGLGSEMGKRLGDATVNRSVEILQADQGNLVPFDSLWWSPPALEELEGVVNPAPPTAPKKPRGPINPTYTTPTQSFTAKAVNPGARRSTSNSQAFRRTPSTDHTTPVVGWAVATHELSKILIPDRQTQSCKPEDLNAEASRIRRNRQSAVGLQPEALVDPGKRMQLRGRKAKAPVEESDSRPVSRANRRQTIGNVAELESESDKVSATGVPTIPKHRRVSVASTTLSTTEEATEAQTMPSEVEKSVSDSKIITTTPASIVEPVLPTEKTLTKSRSPSRQRALKKVPIQAQVSRAPPAFAKAQVKESTAKPADMDALASGVRKMNIKLNVPPKKEQDSQDTKKKAIRAPRKTSAITKPTQSSSQTPKPTSPMAITHMPPPKEALAEAELSHEAMHINPLRMHTQARENGPGVQGALILPPTTKEMRPPAQAQPPSFLPRAGTVPTPVAHSFSHSTFEAAGDLIQATSAKMPNYSSPAGTAPGKQAINSTPSRPVSLHGLPVFTANSPIVFGNATLPANGVGQFTTSEPVGQTSTKVTEGSLQQANAFKEMEKQPFDIWAIPTTPDQRMS